MDEVITAWKKCRRNKEKSPSWATVQSVSEIDLSETVLLFVRPGVVFSERFQIVINSFIVNKNQVYLVFQASRRWASSSLKVNL